MFYDVLTRVSKLKCNFLTDQRNKEEWLLAVLIFKKQLKENVVPRDVNLKCKDKRGLEPHHGKQVYIQQ